MPSGAKPDWMVRRGPTWDRAAAVEVLNAVGNSVVESAAAACIFLAVVRHCGMHACKNRTAQAARLLQSGIAQDRVNSEIQSIYFEKNKK